MNGVMSIFGKLNFAVKKIIGAERMAEYSIAMTAGGMPALFWLWGTSVFGKMAKQYVKEDK